MLFYFQDNASIFLAYIKSCEVGYGDVFEATYWRTKRGKNHGRIMLINQSGRSSCVMIGPGSHIDGSREQDNQSWAPFHLPSLTHIIIKKGLENGHETRGDGKNGRDYG
jgi:hypothetical protein